MRLLSLFLLFFFFNDTATTEIYTLSLHDALPISRLVLVHTIDAGDGLHQPVAAHRLVEGHRLQARGIEAGQDRESTRLNSSHSQKSYAVFFFKKKKKYKKKYIIR